MGVVACNDYNLNRLEDNKDLSTVSLKNYGSIPNLSSMVNQMNCHLANKKFGHWIMTTVTYCELRLTEESYAYGVKKSFRGKWSYSI